MKAHGLLERIGRSYRYRLSDKGAKAALMLILFHTDALVLFHHRPDQALKPPASKVETAYYKASALARNNLPLVSKTYLANLN